MADNNPLAQYLGMDLARDQTATEIAMRQNMAMQQMYANQAMLRPGQIWFAQDRDEQWFGSDSVSVKVEGGEGNTFVSRFTCPTTGECFELSSLERAAVERGMRHLIHKWEKAVQHLCDAGLEKDELAPSLAFLKPRILADAQRERDLEEGLRQAESKAKALLVLCLTPAQQSEFKEHQRFTINVDHKVSGFPTGAFRIKKGSAFNVEHVESRETFCVVAQEKVPVYDQMLTQKLLLEQEPERFFKTANRSRGYDDSINNLMICYYDDHMRRAIERVAVRIIPPAPAPAEEPDNVYRQALREFTARHR